MTISAVRPYRHALRQCLPCSDALVGSRHSRQGSKRAPPPPGETKRHSACSSKGKLLPPNYLKQFLEEDKTLPVPDAVLGLDDDVQGEDLAEAPSVSELLEDPDVRAVFEAAKGLKPIAS